MNLKFLQMCQACQNQTDFTDLKFSSVDQSTLDPYNGATAMTEVSQEEIEFYKRVKAAKAKKKNSTEPMKWSTVNVSIFFYTYICDDFIWCACGIFEI
jgi:hypothetical protein